METIKIDAVGDVCPIPVVKAKKALKNAGEVIITVDNEIAVANLTKMAEGSGHTIESEKLKDGNYSVRIIKSRTDMEKTMETNADNILVVISSDRMGEGSEDLGTALMKSFIYAISEREDIPRRIIFYNGGARLTSKNSALLTELGSLEGRGVEILTCGACINFYGLDENPAVGRVTNMYEISELMFDADKIIKP